MAFFILEDALSVWTNLGKHSLFVWLFVSIVKTGTRRIIRLQELPSVVRRLSPKSAESRIKKSVEFAVRNTPHVFDPRKETESEHFACQDNFSSKFSNLIVCAFSVIIFFLLMSSFLVNEFFPYSSRSKTKLRRSLILKLFPCAVQMKIHSLKGKHPQPTGLS